MINTPHPNYEQVIDQLGIDDHDRLLSYIKPAMYASLEKHGGEFPLGASRFGGRPDLASDLVWPTCKAGPLPFVAQINLSELPDGPRRDLLPPTGMLYFFYGNPLERLHFPDDDPAGGGAEVLYAADVESLSRTKPPQSVHRDDVSMQELSELRARGAFVESDVTMDEPQLLHFRRFNSFPDWEHPVWEYRYGLRERPDMEGLGVDWPSEKTKYPHFQMLGHALPVQHSVCRCIRDDLPDDATPQEREAYVRWALDLETLFEAIDVVGDCTLYCMIARDDLVAQRWDRTRWTIQCT